MSEGPASDDAIGISSDESVDPEARGASRSTARGSLHAGRPPGVPIVHDANEGSPAAGSPSCDASAPSVPSRDPSAALPLAQRMPEEVPRPRQSGDIGHSPCASQEAFQRLQGRGHVVRAEERRILHQQPLALQQRKAFLEQKRTERHEADDALYHEALGWYMRALEEEDRNLASRALLRAKGKVAALKRWGHESTRWAALADRIRAEGLCAGVEAPRPLLRQAGVEVPRPRLPRPRLRPLFSQGIKPAPKATASRATGAVQTRLRDNSTGQFLKQSREHYLVDGSADLCLGLGTGRSRDESDQLANQLRHWDVADSTAGGQMLANCRATPESGPAGNGRGDDRLTTGSQADQHTQEEYQLSRLLGMRSAQRLLQADQAINDCQRTQAKRRPAQVRSNAEAAPPAKRLRTLSDLRAHLQQLEFSAPGRESGEDVFSGARQSSLSEPLEVSC